MSLSRLTLLAVLAVSGCGGSKTNAERLVGKWAYASADGTTGEALNVYVDGTYLLALLQETSASSGNFQEETGTYVTTDSEVTTTPSRWTCAGPDPVATVAYSFSGENLVLMDPSGEIVLAPNNNPAPSNYVVTLGCFAASGFVASPLASVSN